MFVLVFKILAKFTCLVFPEIKTTGSSETSFHVSGHQETVLLSKAATMTMHYFRW